MLRTARRGIALLNVLIFAFLTTSFLVVGIQFTMSAIKQGRNTKSEAQVYNVALAGINHALYWLQKQDPSQTITAFDPKAASSIGPDEDAETGDEQLGLVHEFAVDATQNVWGRYEVARSKNAPKRDSIATGPSSILYGTEPTWTVEDVSLMRGETQAGMVWRVRSRAYLFERKDESALFVLPSPSERQLPTITLEAEVRKAGYQFHQAAIYNFINPGDSQSPHIELEDSNNDGDTTRIEVVDPSGAKHYWAATTESKVVRDGQEVYAPSPATYSLGVTATSDPNYVSPDLATQLDYVFGVRTLDAVKGLADAYYENAGDIPSPQPPASFLYIKPNGGQITFDNGPVLDGGGILFVEGDLKIDGNNDEQNWNGLIFVTGDYEQIKSSNIYGAVINGGKFKIEGDGSKRSKIFFSETELRRVLASIGNTYRLDKSTLRVVEAVPSTTY